jgi:hypothetical protein
LGYGQFERGVANQSQRLVEACFACHGKLGVSKDFVFSHYSRERGKQSSA